jgi:hypothetical protein
MGRYIRTRKATTAQGARATSVARRVVVGNHVAHSKKNSTRKKEMLAHDGYFVRNNRLNARLCVHIRGNAV